jgi:hypothetical protein
MLERRITVKIVTADRRQIDACCNRLEQSRFARTVLADEKGDGGMKLYPGEVLYERKSERKGILPLGRWFKIDRFEINHRLVKMKVETKRAKRSKKDKKFLPLLPLFALFVSALT